MGRKVLAVVVALIAAFAVIMIVEMLNSFLVMPPSTEVMNDPAKLRDFMSSLPTRVYVIVLIGYFLGSFMGGYIVTNMSRRESPGLSLPLLIGGILMIGGLLNFFVMLPGQPMWFIGLSLLIFIPVTLLGSKLAGK
jgi:hypothetical protein